jgi:hypothetical protein
VATVRVEIDTCIVIDIHQRHVMTEYGGTILLISGEKAMKTAVVACDNYVASI